MGPRGQKNKKAPRRGPSLGSTGPSAEYSPSDVSSGAFECPVCFNSCEYFSVGLCNHSICQECSVRMRVLLEANECPICRQHLREVYHSKTLVPFPKMSALTEFLDKKSGIRFEGEEVQARFKALKRHRCLFCKEKTMDFPSFDQLETHCRREHELFYCQLCSEHLKLFTHERRLYNRSQLAAHRRKGDSDDKSHKGHPECKFCDQRYMDKEALFLHLRKEHYFCHFCDSDGRHNDFYPNYDALKGHFGEAHYLCTEGSCIDSQFTHAFRTEIDFKAHRVEVHGSSYSKLDARMNRTVGLELNYKNRRTAGNKPRGGGRNPTREPVPAVFDEPVQHQVLPDVTSAENFPSLGGATGLTRSASGDELAKKLALKSGKSVAKWKANGKSGGEDFPSLEKPSKSAAVAVPARNPTGKNVAQRIRDSERNTVWGHEAPGHRNPKVKLAKPPPLPKTLVEDFPGLDPPSQKKKGKRKEETEEDGGDYYNLRSVANTISSSSTWSLVSNKQGTKKGSQQAKQTGGGGGSSIPGLNYGQEGGGTRSNRYPPDEEHSRNNSVQGLVDDFPSLGPSSNKISAHFQPNTRDPVPNQWDSVSSPELFLPTEATGAKPKSAPPASKPKRPSKAPSSSVVSVYNPPNDFALRNKKLLSHIMRVLGGKSLEFKEFMNVSKKFRDESISSAEFYDRCVEIVGNNNKLMEFLPELIFLLPEIKKQQELYTIHQRKNSFLKIANLQKCDICHQILSSKDFLEHEVIHSLDGDFPSLYAS